MATSDWIDRGVRGYGSYTLNAGNLSAATMQLDGYYSQNGGTALVAGDIVVGGADWEARLVVNGGELRSHSVSVTSYHSGGYRQTGGRHVIDTELTVSRVYQDPWYNGCILGGGELLVSNIVLNPSATFTKTGGVLAASSLLTVTNGNLNIGGGRQQFGRLNLQAAAAFQTNSTVYLLVNDATILAFENSSQVPWASSATLTIVNWKGSWTGGGTHQVFFGSSSAGLSPAQVAQILFQDPLGLAPGLHHARMLQTGEIVPDGVPPTGSVPPKLALLRQSDGTLQITVQGQPSDSYGIDSSSNLFDWTRWTNMSTPQGTASVIDLDVTNALRRFYRALLLQ